MIDSTERLELMQKMADGRADETDARQLSGLLRDHPAFRDEYLAFMATHAALCWEFRDGDGLREVEIETRSDAQAGSIGHTKTWHALRRVDFRWFTAAAALAIVAFFIGRMESPAFANASRIVKAALHSHAEPVEREYIVEVVWEDPEIAESIPSKDIRVATWRDRFWIQVTGRRRFAFGQESAGTTWIALGSSQGIRIAEDELGPILNDVVDLYSLRLESMLQGVLKDHELTITDRTAVGDIIKATPRRLRGWVREVTIEVDRETKAVRQLVARRRSRLRGFSTVTFTLIEARAPDKAKYQLQGHLSDASVVLTPQDDPDRRLEVLEQELGPVTRSWIIEPDHRSKRQ
ncbi:hypothetical protein [Rubinisphaera brasiliensis]|uniref:Uncharacterized protein n=1 Tax=Rubinisphaera brasiliensis (strain ATCC 49424 / DSM 5305 / JCM 21570 / IAM 15109 / NBRC 103401 / IFAM 1448) TaxID=756272 RepID=F0SS23_RUBBR|nr:hypothetical protein [Rubinisphaera brasiliensis]ADY61361.1 hypothetical protein Plabr_3771 [Rubinisphaera brasiliensis DSM 5305]